MNRTFLRILNSCHTIRIAASKNTGYDRCSAQHFRVRVFSPSFVNSVVISRHLYQIVTSVIAPLARTVWVGEWHIDNQKKWIDSINQLKIKFESQFLCLFLSLFLSIRCNPISINEIDDLSVNLLLICLYSSIKFKHGKLSLIISHTVKFRNFCFYWFIHWKGSSCVHDGCALCLKRFTRSPFLSFCVI